jgi:hypothetical protein
MLSNSFPVVVILTARSSERAFFPGVVSVFLRTMAIKKQEFYEGAALHLLARSGAIKSVRYEAPFFLFNERLTVLLKYSTKGRSPWAFTFTPDEQRLLLEQALGPEVVVGLICGSDGVAVFSCEEYLTIAKAEKSAVHISCYRQHGEYYEVNGPAGRLSRKVSPSEWRRILGSEADKR